jgi:class 3 adenylate cyclase
LPNDLRADLIRHYLAAAQTAARSRDWMAVVELADDVLVLDHDNADALTLRTLADRHVGGSQPGAGRRQETVLFADLVGSTVFANRFDVEDLQRLTRAYEQACTPALTALGGYVHRFVGDGILASFGYPTSHEDDAVRAVHAALDLVAAVAATSLDLDAPDARLEVRVGVASGLLVHGDRGGGNWRQPGDLFGAAVNLAARLHDLAAPGQIVVSEPTAALVNRSFDLEPLGAHTLKGFDLPMPVYRVLRRSAAPAAAASRPASPFIGRRQELARLVDLWDEVATGSGASDTDGARSPGATVCITGDPGVGKSRLVHELLQSVGSRLGPVVELHCSAYRSASPLYPVRAAIERYSGFEPDDDDSTRLEKLLAAAQPTALELDALLPELVVLLELDVADRVNAPEVSPLQLREMTLGLLQHWVAEIASTTPTIVVCEDAQWADPSTRELLRRIAAARPPGLLSVITSRTTPEWLEESSLVSIVLQSLAHEESRALANAVTSGALSAALVERIAERSDGIPLFVEQLADSLVTSVGAAGARGAIPASLAELLQARLDAAGPSKSVAQIASVIGREFEPDVVDAVAAQLHADGRLEALDRPVRAHLDRLLESRLIEPSPQATSRLRFRHALVAQAAYESQLLDERRERHEAVAASMLERERTGRPADHAVVARHYDVAGRPLEAIAQYLEASARGHAVGAFTETIEQLRRASELVELLPEVERHPLELAICLSHGLAIASTGGYAAPGVVCDYQRAIDLCTLLRDADEARESVLRALLGLWGYYCAAGDVDHCTTVSDAFRDQLARATIPAGPGSFHACRGVERFVVGDLRGAREHLSLAVELLRDDEPDPEHWPLPNDPLAASLAFISNLELLCGDEVAALSAVEAGLARSEGLPFPLGPFSLAFVCMYESWVHRMRGCFDEAERTASEIIRIGERHGFFDWQITGRIHLAAASAAADPTRAALGEMGEAIALWRGLGGEILVPSLLVERGWGYLALGDLALAAECLTDAMSIMTRGQHLAVADAERLRAELLAQESGSSDDDPVTVLRGAMHHAANQGARLFVLRCGASYQRLFGLDGLDDELRSALDGAVHTFGPTSAVVRLVLGDRMSTS